MRIALIRKKYTPHGGAERYLRLLIDGLLRSGHEVHVFAACWESRPGIVFHKIPVVKGLSFLEVVSFAYFARRAIKQEQFDLVHSLERTLCQDVYRAGDGCHKEWLRQRRRSCSRWKNIITRFNPLHISILALEKRLYSYPDTKLIISNSQRGKQEIINNYNYPEARIKVVYNGVDTESFCPGLRQKHRQAVRKGLGIGEGEYVLLWVGSGFKRKGLDFLIKSLRLLWREGQRNWRLLVVGKGEIDAYQRQLQGKEFKEKIIFLGPQADVCSFYGTGDVFVLPTVYEPFANVCLEALACGLPVITSAMNGVAEILTPDTGSVVDNPADVRRLADIITYWQDENLRQKAVLACRELAQKFTSQQNVRQTIRIYQELSAEK